MIELKDIGERLVSIVSVEHYALGLLKMLETQSQKEVANYIGVSQSKLSPIIQLLTEIHINKPCMIVRYVCNEQTNTYHLLLEHMGLSDVYSYRDIFKFTNDSYYKVLDDLNAELDLKTNTYIVAKLPQITIDALHNLEYKHKA